MKSFNPAVGRFLREDDSNVAWRMLIDLPGVESTSRSNGYWGSMRVTMWDGKEFLELPRLVKSQDRESVCIRRLAVQALRYVRSKRKRRQER